MRNLGAGVLGAIGATLLLICIGLEVRALWTRSAMERRLDEVGSSRVREHGSIAEATRREAEASGLIGKIEMPRIGLSAVVLEGETERTLSKGVGHVTRSAYPGERGNVALAAHRDTYFAPLEQAQRGDSIWIRTPDGRFGYTVDTILVVNPGRVDVLESTGRAELTLITCYPFYFIGSAPKRYIVRALPLSDPLTVSRN